MPFTRSVKRQLEETNVPEDIVDNESPINPNITKKIRYIDDKSSSDETSYSYNDSDDETDDSEEETDDESEKSEDDSEDGESEG